jgi:hypothetical protein
VIDGSTIKSLDVIFTGVTEMNQFLEFPRGILKVLVKDSTLMRVPGTMKDVFNNPSIYVKINSNFGYAKRVVRTDRKRLIFSQKAEKSKGGHPNTSAAADESRINTERNNKTLAFNTSYIQDKAN